MTDPKQAFIAAAGTDPGNWKLLFALVISAVLFTFLAWLLMGLWEAQQDGELKHADMNAYMVRATVVVLVLLWVVTGSH